MTDEPDQMSASMETLEMRGTELPMTNISPKEPNILERFRMMLDENRKTVSISANLLIHALVIIYFGFATNHYLVSAKSKFIHFAAIRILFYSRMELYSLYSKLRNRMV